MKAVLQRTKSARVEVEGRIVGSIDQGLVILLGIGPADTSVDVQKLADKVAKLRLFDSNKNGFDQDVTESGGAILVVSQFTLLADTKKGRRPSFSRAASPNQAEPLYEAFKEALRAKRLTVEAGMFGAMMDVHLINDGPVTIILDTND